MDTLPIQTGSGAFTFHLVVLTYLLHSVVEANSNLKQYFKFCTQYLLHTYSEPG
jgi:hypothetical protein